jgi:hypothetical protein
MSRVVVRTSVTEPGGDLGSHARHVKGGSWASMTVRGSFDHGSACQRVVDLDDGTKMEMFALGGAYCHWLTPHALCCSHVHERKKQNTRRKKNFHQWIKYNFKSVGELLVISFQVFRVPGV